MDPYSSPPIPPHVLRERKWIDRETDMRTMRYDASKMNEDLDNNSPTGSPVNRYERRHSLTTSPVKPSPIAGGKRRTKKKCGGKRHKKSKTSKKRGHKKSKTSKKRGSRKRA
jgi:hypothetical protein